MDSTSVVCPEEIAILLLVIVAAVAELRINMNIGCMGIKVSLRTLSVSILVDQSHNERFAESTWVDALVLHVGEIDSAR